MSTRFTVASHILTVLAVRKDEAVPSDVLAFSTNTSPAVVRQILSLLGKAGLTRAQLGQGGGSLLARPASEISLLDVHRATESGGLIEPARNAPSSVCTVGRHIRSILAPHTARAEDAFYSELARVSIDTLAKEARRRQKEPPAKTRTASR